MTKLQIVNNVLYGADDLIGEWVHDRMGVSKPDVPFVGLGITNGQDLLAGLLFFSQNGSDISCAVAGTPHGAWPRAIAQAFRYPFRQLGLSRVSAEIELSNERSIRLAKGFGFVREGVKRKAAADGGHVGVFGLLEKDFILRKYL